MLKEYVQGPHGPAADKGNVWDPNKHRHINPGKNIRVGNNKKESDIFEILSRPNVDIKSMSNDQLIENRKKVQRALREAQNSNADRIRIEKVSRIFEKSGII